MEKAILVRKLFSAQEGSYVLICKTIYRQALTKDNFTNQALSEANFPDQDYSVMYIAEIEEAYEIAK